MAHTSVSGSSQLQFRGTKSTTVINQTLLATKTNKEIDIYQIISDSAGKQMGIPIDVEQLKSLT